MSAFGDTVEIDLLTHMFRDATWAKPVGGGGLYVALFTAAPTDAGGGTESTYDTYARVAIPQTDAQWNVAAIAGGYEATNAVPITFPVPGANDTDLVAFGIFDASTGGDLLLHGALSNAPVSVSTGVPILFAIGDLNFSITEFAAGEATDYLYLTVINHILRTDTWAKPASMEMRLYTTMPGKDGAGGVESTGGAYQPIDRLGDQYWTEPDASGVIENAVVFDFPAANASYDGILGHCFTTPSGILLRKTYAAPLPTIPYGGRVRIDEAALQITAD